MILLAANQANNIISSDAICGIAGTVIGTIMGALLGYILPRLGDLRFSIQNYHSKYYTTDNFGHFDKVIQKGASNGFCFECDLYVYNNKNINTSIDLAYMEVVCNNEKINCETLTSELHNITANELKIQHTLVKFEPKSKNITVGSVRKIYIKYRKNGKNFMHRKKLNIKNI